MANLIERHRNDIRGVLSCLDRVVIQGTIPSICHPKAMATMLDSGDIRLFDYTQFVHPFRDAIRAHAERTTSIVNQVRKCSPQNATAAAQGLSGGRTSGVNVYTYESP